MEKHGTESVLGKAGGIRLLIAVVASAAVAALSWAHFYEDQEARIYDLRFKLRNDLFGAPQQFVDLATLDIDDLALQSFGFPFTRNRHAVLVDILHRYGTQMIGFDIFFYEPSAPLLPPEEVAKLEKATFSKDEIFSMIKDHDQDFVRSSRNTGIVYLAQTFEVAEQGAEFARRNLRKRSPEKDAALAILAPYSVPATPEASEGLFHTTDIEIPLTNFSQNARGIGFALPKPDHDGIVRRYRLALAYDGRLYFALAFLMACDYLQVPLEKVEIVTGEYVRLPDAHLPDGSVGDMQIPITERGEMLINWIGPYHSTFRHLPYNLILDFAETEPQNRALKLAKRIVHRQPDIAYDDEAYLEAVAAMGDGNLDGGLLLEMRNVVLDCMEIEKALSENPDLTVEAFAASLGVPKEEIPDIAEILGGFFGRIKSNLQVYRVLSENPDLSLAQVAERMGISRLEDIKLAVGIIRDLIRKGSVSPEDHPLFFLDRITSAGLHGSEAVDRIVSRDDFDGTVFFYGLTATGTHDLNPTPFGAREPMLGAHVNVFNTILTRNFLERIPKWGNATIMLALGLLLGLLIPRVRALPGAGIIVVLLAVHLAAAFLLFVQMGIWVDILGPISTLIVGYLSITLYSYIQKEKEKEFVQGAFGHYLDSNVIDQLVENPESLGQLGGDMRLMTAFFSDVASFSGISENLTPVELVELLNEYLSEMCDIIAEHNGTIDKFEGDAIIAFYGAPLGVEDHATRAVLAAIDMQAKIAELRDGWEAKGRMLDLRRMWAEQGRGEFFRVRMGINTGEMVVGNMGSHTRVDYTIMGDAVNLAARLEGAGKNYAMSTMVSETTYRASQQLVEARELDSIRVVGRDEAVRVYEVLGRRGELDPKVSEVADFYMQGLGLYRERRWDEAIASFEAGLKVDPEDGPCKVFIERCREFEQVPPPEDWDAVHVLESK